MDITSLQEAYNAAVDEVEKCSAAWDELADDASDDDIQAAKTSLDDAVKLADTAKERIDAAESVKRAREQHSKVELPSDAVKLTTRVDVDEPDMYTRNSKHRFINDLFARDIKNDPIAADRLARHQAHEVEKYAVATGTLGGIIPPQYLVNLYAKALRNGRVLVDQVNRDDPLPDEGMSIIVPRLTAGTAAAAQSSESTTVTTQDPTETDLTVNVRTIAGYVPVSRQTLERASYSEGILMEDLVARYDASVDTGAISGNGNSGTLLGILNTSSIKTSTTSTATVTDVWPKIADVIQQINTDLGGLGYVADKIFMHPRRWGFFEAALDQNDRPVFGIYGQNSFNVVGEGPAAGYGLVGSMHGLPVYSDANIPTNLGSGTNEDRIIVLASRVVHLWERKEDPVTLAFEQQAGTALQVQLVAYGYAAFTAGRYPSAVGVVEGAGLAAPSF